MAHLFLFLFLFPILIFSLVNLSNIYIYYWMLLEQCNFPTVEINKALNNIVF